MKVSVSAIHYGTEFESEWKPASDPVQCFELPSSYTPSSRRSREMMQTNEKLNISILFFICESTVGYLSLSKADAICMSGCFCLGIFLHISHSRIPFTFLTSVSFIFLREALQTPLILSVYGFLSMKPKQTFSFSTTNRFTFVGFISVDCYI